MSYDDSPERAKQRIGSVLKDRWQIRQVLGMGGSAWVYVADDKAGRRAAIKVLHSAFLPHADVVARFVREAQVANKIGHSGVVRVLDNGTTPDGLPFLAMDLLEGETLEQRAARKGGRLPAEEVLWEMDQVLDVLAAAHAKGIVHRDIKPENIFLTYAREVHSREIKLLDFGIARLLDGISSSNTRAGVLMGTLEYMAPEQGRGDWEKVGTQSDLWAVGATMFTLLSGRPVHLHEDLFTQMRAVAYNRAPPMAQVAPWVPRSVALLVDAALEFDAPNRWSDARAMQMALRIANMSRDEQGAPNSEDSPSSEEPRYRRPPIVAPPQEPPASIAPIRRR